MAAVLMAMKGPLLRGLCWCRALATSSLPVPDSPVMRTLMLELESRPMARNSSCIAGAAPMIPETPGRVSLSCAVAAGLRVTARRTSATASSMSKGLARYSKAPPRKAATARSRSA